MGEVETPALSHRFGSQRSRLVAALHRLSPASPRWLRIVLSIDGFVLPSECRLLYQLAQEAVEGDIVEIGTYRGRATSALALGSRDGHGVKVYGVDPHHEAVGVFGQRYGPSDAQLWRLNLTRSGVRDLVQEVSLDSLDAANGWSMPLALVFVDGDHRYGAVCADVEAWSPHLVDHGLLALHDSIRPGLGPTRLVRQLVDDGDWAIAVQVSDTTVLWRTLVGPAPRTGLRERGGL